MRIKEGKEKDYKCFSLINKQDHTRDAMLYLERWADLMEISIDNGQSLEDIALKTFLQSDLHELSTFVCGIIINVLTQVWEYGDELRIWYNKNYYYIFREIKCNEEGV